MTSSTPSAIEPLHVVDTHALIWYLRADERLSPKALEVFHAAERGETLLIIPVIVLAELYFANAKFKWFSSYETLHNDILTRHFFRVVTLEPQHILEFDLDQLVPEMHDRIITGTARRLSASVVTSDPAIVSSKLVDIVW